MCKVESQQSSALFSIDNSFSGFLFQTISIPSWWVQQTKGFIFVVILRNEKHTEIHLFKTCFSVFMWRFIKYHCISLYHCCSGLAVETCFWIFQQYFYTWHTLHTFFFACLFFLHILLLHLFQICSSFLTCFPTFWYFLNFFGLRCLFCLTLPFFQFFQGAIAATWGTEELSKSGGTEDKKRRRKRGERRGEKKDRKFFQKNKGENRFRLKRRFNVRGRAVFHSVFLVFLVCSSLSPRGRGTRVDTRKVRSLSWAVTCAADVFGLNL